MVDIDVYKRQVVKTRTTATESLTPGEGMAGKATVGVNGKTKVAEYVYDGDVYKRQLHHQYEQEQCTKRENP